MSILQKLFSQFRSDVVHRSGFGNWPAPPSVKQIAAGRIGRLAAIGQLPTVERDPQKYGPAIVIGLGHTGNHVLQQLIAGLGQDSAGRQKKLYGIQVSHMVAAPLHSDIFPVRQFDLTAGGSAAEAFAANQRQNHRQAIHQLFRVFDNLAPFREYLRTAMIEIERNDIRVFLVASVAEAEIGIIGDVLQALHHVQARVKNPFASITALLTLASPHESLDEGEIYAALREIGRFTFSGWHWMETSRGMPEKIIQAALLDQVFLIEAANPSRTEVDLRQVPFGQGVGQALTEALFTLLHPSARPLWEQLRSDLLSSSAARAERHVPFLHTLGLAVLHLPVLEIKEYVAARLAYAAVFGEQATPEGLLPQGQATIDYQPNGRNIVRDWFYGEPASHPLFNWILDVNEAYSFRNLPPLSAGSETGYQGAFRTQLAHGLNNLLNDRYKMDHLAQAQAGLYWLLQHLDQVKSWLEDAPLDPKGNVQRLRFLLESWQATVFHLLQQIEAWEFALLGKTRGRNDDRNNLAEQSSGHSDWRKKPPSASDDWRGRETLGPLTGDDWRRKETVSSDGNTWQTNTKPAEQQKLTNDESRLPSLARFLQQQRQIAEDRLTAVAHGQISRAVTSFGQQGYGEIEAYYDDTVRPELTRYNHENSAAFRRMSDRLGWWIDLPKDREPQLYLICLPPDQAGQGENNPPPGPARFTPHTVSAFGDALLSLASREAERNDLTGAWLTTRFHRQSRFLQRADQPFLAYEWEEAAESIRRHSFVIGPNQAIAGAIEKAVFPNLPAASVHDLGDGEPTRLTSFTAWLNIPLPAISTPNKFYERYAHQRQLHLYPQEQNATRYEKRLRSVTKELRLLSPEFTLILVDPRLVSLFCQALFCQLIKSHSSEMDFKRYWTVSPPNNLYAPLQLADDDGGWRGVWDALNQLLHLAVTPFVSVG